MMTPRSGLLTAALAALYLPLASPVLAQDTDATTAAILMGGAAAAQTVTPELPW
jgi:hypothetical protein